MKVSTLAIVTSLVVIVGLVTAASMYTTGNQALERLGILVAVISSIVPGLIAALRADAAATQTNGNLDARIGDAVQKALSLRRHTDAAVVTASGSDNDTMEGPGVDTPIDSPVVTVDAPV